MKPTKLSAILACTGVLFASTSVIGAEYYSGKVVRMIIGYPPGTGFEIYARALIRYLPAHLPGSPTIIIQNKPGAGGMNATSWLANVAPKDGTVLSLLNPMNTTAPLLYPKRTKFDARKLTWIGSMNTEQSICGFWSKKVNSFEDLKKKEILFAAGGPTSSSTIQPKILKNLLGLNMRIVTGYRGLGDRKLSAQRGETDGYCGLLVSNLKATLWSEYKDGRFKVPLQLGLKRHPDIPNVPNAYEFVKSREDKEIFALIFAPWSYGRPVAGPPGLSSKLTKMLRDGFNATLKSKSFLANAKKLNLEIDLTSGEDVAKLIGDLYDTPQKTIERTRAIINSR